MADSAIEWTDATWNPVVGCTRASAGCDNCYAVVMTKRLEAMGQEKYSGLVNPGKSHFNGVVRTVEEVLTIPLSWKKPRRVFVNSMSDLFHKDVPFEFIDKVFAIMALTPHHTYQVLTKRPERMAEYLNTRGRVERINETITVPECADGFAYTLPERICDELDAMEFQSIVWPLPNVWLGTSVENQTAADERIPHLLACPAEVRFLSCEPLLGPVNLSNLDGLPHYEPAFQQVREKVPGMESMASPVALRMNCLAGTSIQEYADDFAVKGVGGIAMPTMEVQTERIHWVICGGESGPNARPMHPDWAGSLRDQCQAGGVHFFFKQWGEWAPDEALPADGPHLRVMGANREYLNSNGEWEPCFQSTSARVLNRVGKHRAGRLLDGQEWNEFPADAKGEG